MRSSPESKEDEITRSKTKTDPLWKIGRDVRSLGSIGLVFCSMDLLCNFGLWSLIRKSESERSEKTLSYFQFALESEFEREKRLFVLLWREKPTLNPGRATRSQFQMRSWPKTLWMRRQKTHLKVTAVLLISRFPPQWCGGKGNETGRRKKVKVIGNRIRFLSVELPISFISIHFWAPYVWKNIMYRVKRHKS